MTANMADAIAPLPYKDIAWGMGIIWFGTLWFFSAKIGIMRLENKNKTPIVADQISLYKMLFIMASLTILSGTIFIATSLGNHFYSAP